MPRGGGNDDNRADQMNPNNDSYWESRGYDERPDDWAGRIDDDGDDDDEDDDDGDDDDDDGDDDNRADQLNPNNDVYWSSRGEEKPD